MPMRRFSSSVISVSSTSTPSDTLQGPNRFLDIAHNLILERAAQGRQRQGDLHLAFYDPHLADHAQFDETLVQLGIHDPFECFAYLCFRDQSSVPPSGL